jgi:citrate lyase subunit beta / citryl-CoA lyase
MEMPPLPAPVLSRSTGARCPPSRLRSYLFAPGNCPAGMKQALGSIADAVIFDLEDSVPADQKLQARAHVHAAIADCATSTPEIHVRINRLPDGRYDADDAEAVVCPRVTAIRLPKAEDPIQVRALADVLTECEHRIGLSPGHTRLYLTIETALGVMNAAALAQASPRVQHLNVGPHDLCEDLGVPDGQGTAVARSLLVIASRATGLGPPVDGAYLGTDTHGLARSTQWGRALGFYGRSAASIDQLEILHSIFDQPTTSSGTAPAKTDLGPDHSSRTDADPDRT